MKSFGGKSKGARLERMRASPNWAGERFRNVHPVLPGLRDPNTPMPSLKEFVCGGERRVPFVTSLGVGAHLEAWGVPRERIVELDWWESHKVPESDVKITAAPSQHFSGRGLKDRNATLWSSLVVRSQRHAVFFSGDTGLTTEYRAIRERFGPFDLVMLEIGGLHPSWGDVHLGPANALKALTMLGGGPFLPIHWGTFCLAMHEWDEPAETLLHLAPKSGTQLLMPRLGEPIEPSHIERVEPWWRVADATARNSKETVSATPVPKTMPWPID